VKVVHVVRQFSPSVGGLEDTVLSLTRAGSSRYPLAPAVLRHLKGADVVHVHAIDFFFDFLALTRPLHRRRLIATTHGGFFHTGAFQAAKKLWFKTITRASITAYDRIVACSQSDAELFAASAGQRLMLIENGINQAKFLAAGSQTPRKTILSFGRFARHKRTDALLSVFKHLYGLDPSWRLIIAGREADQKASELVGMADQLGIADAVRFVFNPADAELRSLMGEASFFASLSDYEGFGLAAVEAMSAGLVPILSGIPAFARLVSAAGVGLNVDADDPAAAAAAIAALPVGNVDLQAEWRQRVMAIAARYDWEEVANRYGMVYQSAISKGAVIRPAIRSGAAG
jgi:alpha-1,3-mannosyltransferase